MTLWEIRFFHKLERIATANTKAMPIPRVGEHIKIKMRDYAILMVEYLPEHSLVKIYLRWQGEVQTNKPK